MNESEKLNKIIENIVEMLKIMSDPAYKRDVVMELVSAEFYIARHDYPSAWFCVERATRVFFNGLEHEGVNECHSPNE